MILNALKCNHLTPVGLKGLTDNCITLMNAVFFVVSVLLSFICMCVCIITCEHDDSKVFFDLVGPCALEYTRMKTPDHYWTDPPADELVQRHRIHSSGTPPYIPANTESPRRRALQVAEFYLFICLVVPGFRVKIVLGLCKALS